MIEARSKTSVTESVQLMPLTIECFGCAERLWLGVQSQITDTVGDRTLRASMTAMIAGAERWRCIDGSSAVGSSRQPNTWLLTYFSAAGAAAGATSTASFHSHNLIAEHFEELLRLSTVHSLMSR